MPMVTSIGADVISASTDSQGDFCSSSMPNLSGAYPTINLLTLMVIF